MLLCTVMPRWRKASRASGVITAPGATAAPRTDSMKFEPTTTGAMVAFSRYGKERHASGLNVGDCLSYALAERLKVPLLFVGNDFSRTELEAAL